MIIYPMIHSKGTPFLELVEQHKEVLKALEQAIEKLSHAAPHRRDYLGRSYPDYLRAQQAHLARELSLMEVKQQIEMILSRIEAQEN